MRPSCMLAILGLAGSALAQNKLKIMPLGDSITEITCWRSILWDGLAAAGVTSRVQFVGSMTDNTQNCTASDPNWDHHHEGHSGFLAIDIANSDLTGWLAAAKPDIVQFMLGTNDVSQGHSTTDILAAYTKMVQEMRASNANMKIIVDLVIPLSYDSAQIVALNNAIPAWAQQQNTTASPIHIADCNTGFSTSWLRDGVHPNAQGDQFIASRILPVMLQAIGSGGGSVGTTITTTTSAHTTSPTGGSLPKYSQCGGSGWTGSGTCVSGTTCQVSNPYYSQCL